MSIAPIAEPAATPAGDAACSTVVFDENDIERFPGEWVSSTTTLANHGESIERG